MKKLTAIIAASALLLCAAGCGLGAAPAPAPTPEPTHTLLPTPTEEPTPLPTPTPTPAPELSVGDRIYFGSYDQEGNGGSEPIQWRVLSVDDGCALVISEMVLDQMEFNSVRESVTWRSSSIRYWLNHGFLSGSFTPAEQGCIVAVTNANEANPDYRTPSGADTEDSVFLLSVSQAQEYFADGADMAAQGTNAAYKHYIEMDMNTYYSPWWLRTSGAGDQAAASVYLDQGIDTEGYWVDREIIGVRPAMWLDIELAGL